MRRPLAVAAGLGIVSAVAVAGCGGAQRADSSTPPPECTTAALAGPATTAAEAMGRDNLYTVDTVNCADGWAVTAGLLASKENPAMGAPTSFVFRQQDGSWVSQDKAAVCGTDPVATTPPADAAIPAALFVSGCAAG